MSENRQGDLKHEKTESRDKIRVSLFYQGCKRELELNAYNPPESSEARNAYNPPGSSEARNAAQSK